MRAKAAKWWATVYMARLVNTLGAPRKRAAVGDHDCNDGGVAGRKEKLRGRAASGMFMKASVVAGGTLGSLGLEVEGLGPPKAVVVHDRMCQRHSIGVDCDDALRLPIDDCLLHPQRVRC